MCSSFLVENSCLACLDLYKNGLDRLQPTNDKNCWLLTPIWKLLLCANRTTYTARNTLDLLLPCNMELDARKFFLERRLFLWIMKQQLSLQGATKLLEDVFRLAWRVLEKVRMGDAVIL